MSETSDDGKREQSGAAAPSPEAPAVPAKGGSVAPSALIARVTEWFWRGAALREARRQAAAASSVQEELLRRAKLAAEAGARLLEPSPPLDAGPADALALDLYRQATHWVLAAAGGWASKPLEVAPRTPNDALAGLPDATLSRLSESRESLSELRSLVQELDFIEVASLPLAKQRELAQRLARLANALLERALEPGRRAEVLWFQRLARVGALLVGLTVGLAFVIRSSKTDLALGQPWQASSAGHGGCTSPQQDCGSEFFFHTQEENEPWLQIDLGSSRKFSEVRVTNRGDCCGERAVPLLLEVSDDGRRFRQVARRDEDFQSWSVQVEPVTARYVRVRSPRRTILHLQRLSVLR